MDGKKWELRSEAKQNGKQRRGKVGLERTRVHELIRTECMSFLSMLYSNQITKDTMEQV